MKACFNKKGAALAYVIIIGGALLILSIMGVAAANASIRIADNGIKSREAYLNSKSGIEYAKILTTDIKSEINNQLTASPESITELPVLSGPYYAYYDTADGFHEGLTAVNSDYQNSTIQISYEIEHQVTEIPPVNPEDPINYDYNMLIRFTSVGRSSEPRSFFGFQDKGVTLKYEIEPLKGAVVIGSGEGGEPGEAEVLVTEDSAFDANISADMSCYLRMDDSAARLYGFNNQSTFAEKHSIAYTKPILKSDAGLAIKANKIYFLGSPSININREDNTDTMPHSLYANYIYFGHDISITNIKDTNRFELKPLPAGSTCTVFFDDITLTVSYYDSENQLHTETKELDGYYQFGGTSNFLYDVLKNYEGVVFQWPDYGTMKLTAPAAIAEANNKFDPYLIRPNLLGISQIGSGRFEGWSHDNGHLYTNNGNTFDNLLSFLYPINPESNVSNMLILYANSFNNILDDKPLILKAKQIRLAASMADNPAGFSIPSNKHITFETDLFSYYGGNISDQGANNSLILKSKSGGATVPVYIAQATQIGSYSFPAGYFLLADGINLLDSDSNAVATVSQTEIPTSGDTIELTSKSILFEGSLLEFNKKANIIANEPTTVTINADRINFYHEGAGGGNRGDLVLKPSEENPILLYIVKDLVVSKSKKGEISTFYVIKAGFYLITQEVSLETLEADPNQTNPVTGVSGIYEGLAMSEPTSYSTPIPPVFSAPGVPMHTGNSSFTPISGAEMGGIYK